MQASYKDGSFGPIEEFDSETLKKRLSEPNVDHVEVFEATPEQVKYRQKLFSGKKRYQKAIPIKPRSEPLKIIMSTESKKDFDKNRKTGKHQLQDLIEDLELKFDAYHERQLEINDPQNADYYLFMGNAYAIGEAIDLAKNYLSHEKENLIEAYEDGKQAAENAPKITGQHRFESIFNQE